MQRQLLGPRSALQFALFRSDFDRSQLPTKLVDLLKHLPRFEHASSHPRARTAARIRAGGRRRELELTEARPLLLVGTGSNADAPVSCALASEHS